MNVPPVGPDEGTGLGRQMGLVGWGCLFAQIRGLKGTEGLGEGGMG